MKFLLACLSVSILFLSCKEDKKILSEDFSAMCFMSQSNEIEIEKGLFMRSQKPHYILFIYHDSLFQVEIKDKKTIYSYLKSGRTPKDSLQSIFNEYGKTTLKEQLKSMHQNGYMGTCDPEAYFLLKRDETMNFGLFEYEDYRLWNKRFSHKKIILSQKQFPKVYQTIYHTLNSKQWDYFMGNDYYYKDVRTYRKIRFLYPD